MNLENEETCHLGNKVRCPSCGIVSLVQDLSIKKGPEFLESKNGRLNKTQMLYYVCKCDENSALVTDRGEGEDLVLQNGAMIVD